MNRDWRILLFLLVSLEKEEAEKISEDNVESVTCSYNC